MRVLIAAGGTAGHINPALAIAGALKKADPTAEIHFAGRKEGMEYRLVTHAVLQNTLQAICAMMPMPTIVQ